MIDISLGLEFHAGYIHVLMELVQDCCCLLMAFGVDHVVGSGVTRRWLIVAPQKHKQLHVSVTEPTAFSTHTTFLADGALGDLQLVQTHHQQSVSQDNTFVLSICLL